MSRRSSTGTSKRGRLSRPGGTASAGFAGGELRRPRRGRSGRRGGVRGSGRQAAVFAELARVCRADTILATNTSYLDPRAVFEAANPARLIGLHFFSPAQIMKLLEIVPLPDTAER